MDKGSDFQSMMSTFMKNAQKMQESLKGAYQEIAEKNKDRIVTGTAVGDLVTVTINLKLEIQKIESKPELFQEAPTVIFELIAAAVNQAIAKAQETVKTEMLQMAQKMGMPPNTPMPFGDVGPTTTS